MTDASTLNGDGALGLQLVENMEKMTWDRIGSMALENVAQNAAHLSRGKSIAMLRDQPLGENDSAVVIAAGPSVKKKDPLAQLIETGYKGAIIATESAMSYCLRKGVVPDLVVTADPHAIRIVRWFGDPDLTPKELDEDDYYRRQDMDEAFANELKMNREMLALMDQYGSQIKISLSTASSANVVKRALETGMEVYWWNPMLDDPDQEDSHSRRIMRGNRLPCVNAGGNVGTAAWMMAHAVLGKKHVAVTGMDFSYYGDTPYKNTQYYYEAVDLVGEENLDSLYIHVHNPHTGMDFFTDPAYMWYRQAFLELAKDADCKTYNCTEGGILFGDGIEFLTLSDFLQRMS